MRHVRLLHSHPFPTRRSSDLNPCAPAPSTTTVLSSGSVIARNRWTSTASVSTDEPSRSLTSAGNAKARSAGTATRSEEHTSELQSPCNLVCRLLLEKKKKHR